MARSIVLEIGIETGGGEADKATSTLRESDNTILPRQNALRGQGIKLRKSIVEIIGMAEIFICNSTKIDSKIAH